jgi:hypothetical protein
MAPLNQVCNVFSEENILYELQHQAERIGLRTPAKGFAAITRLRMLGDHAWDQLLSLKRSKPQGVCHDVVVPPACGSSPDLP